MPFYDSPGFFVKLIFYVPLLVPFSLSLRFRSTPLYVVMLATHCPFDLYDEPCVLPLREAFAGFFVWWLKLYFSVALHFVEIGA